LEGIVKIAHIGVDHVILNATPEELANLADILDRPVTVTVDKAAELDDLLTLRCRDCGTEAHEDYADGDNCPACGERGALRYRR
jgi:rubrerythrin